MQIVIDVPEKLTYEGFERPFTEEEKNILIKAIGNGTPLPKGHGRLIDADALWKKWVFDAIGKQEIDEAPTIIEADKAESEDKGMKIATKIPELNYEELIWEDESEE